MKISPEAKSLLEQMAKGDMTGRRHGRFSFGPFLSGPETVDKRHRELLARGFIEMQRTKGHNDYHPVDTYSATPAGCEYLNSLLWSTRIKKHGGRLLELFMVGIVSAGTTQLMIWLFK